jgi:hypothetical protein
VSFTYDLKYFAESVLLESADRQDGNKIQRFDFVDLCRQIDPSVGDGYIAGARTYIQSNNFGKFTPENSGVLQFKIYPQGLIEASRIRQVRGTNLVPPPPLQPRWKFWYWKIDSSRSGAIAGWLCAILTLIGIFVALWIAGKI